MSTMLPGQGPTTVLPATEVHLYCAPLDGLVDHLASWANTLSAEEATRAARFYFERDRQRFIVARGCLRMILTRYLEVAAPQLQFSYNAYGKPSLAPPYATSGLMFNLAHSGEFALYALAYRRQVGVDIEQVRSTVEYEQLAGQIFSSAEQQSWQQIPADQRLLAFFNGWTRKEAFIKAQGLGLSLPLAEFTVTLAPGEAAPLVSTDYALAEAGRWSLQALPAPPNYVGAVVAEGQDWIVRWPSLELNPAVTLVPFYTEI